MPVYPSKLFTPYIYDAFALTAPRQTCSPMVWTPLTYTIRFPLYVLKPVMRFPLWARLTESHPDQLVNRMALAAPRQTCSPGNSTTHPHNKTRQTSNPFTPRQICSPLGWTHLTHNAFYDVTLLHVLLYVQHQFANQPPIERNKTNRQTCSPLRRTRSPHS